MRWKLINSTAIWVNDSDTSSVLELETNRLIQNVNELEFELSRIDVDETTR